MFFFWKVTVPLNFLNKPSCTSNSYFLDPDATVFMLKSLVDQIGDASLLWDIVKRRVLPNLQIWNILIEKGNILIKLWNQRPAVKNICGLEAYSFDLKIYRMNTALPEVSEAVKNPVLKIEFPDLTAIVDICKESPFLI
jgi:hypothetical protein